MKQVIQANYVTIYCCEMLRFINTIIRRAGGMSPETYEELVECLLRHMNLKHISMLRMLKIQFTATLSPLLSVSSCPLISDLSRKILDVFDVQS
jgi:hypothetical protein